MIRRHKGSGWDGGVKTQGGLTCNPHGVTTQRRQVFAVSAE